MTSSASPQSQSPNTPPYSPSQIYTAYNGTNLPNQGANQTIGIICDIAPAISDIQDFWSEFQVTRAQGTTVQFIPVQGTSGYDQDGTESTLDVEWASSMAPASNIALFYTGTTSSTNVALGYQAVLTALQNGTMPSLHVLSISLGFPESSLSTTYLNTNNQIFSAISAYGVTIFAGSGDGGSNPNKTSGKYNAGNSGVSVEFPASSPFVTGVGGTVLTLTPSGASTGEIAWSVAGNGSNGTGGGQSSYFPRPSFQQNAPGMPSGSYRCVPDVAMDAAPRTGGYIYCTTAVTYNPNNPNQNPNPLFEIGGTSLGTPIWAGICARLNEARVAFNPQLGYFSGTSFNTMLYSLIGTSAFRDITGPGSNGAFNAGAGYDELTGCGVPNIASMFHASINAFFASEVDLGGGTYYLQFNTGYPFGYYNYDEFPFIYHVDLGFEALSTATDSNNGVYFYDFTSGHEFYTSPSFYFPYLFDFTLNATLYYYPQSGQAGSEGYYTTNPRYFYNTASGAIFTQ